ncbi:MAG: tryptophan--tRNA ligase, partial [bacterium]
REIARKFNNTYGKVFPEPEVKLTKFARLTGLDGKTKMSKSLGNTLLMSDAEDEIAAKVRKAVTDPQKVRRGDPGRPDVCTVFTYHKKFNTAETPEIREGCESGALGCVDCKKNCAAKIAAFFAPIREKRAYYEAHPNEVDEIINNGEQRARTEARQTMQEVREAMKFGII